MEERLGTSEHTYFGLSFDVFCKIGRGCDSLIYSSVEGASVRVVWRKNLAGVEGTLWILHSTQRMRIPYEIELQFCRFFPCTAGKCYHQDAAGFLASARTCCILSIATKMVFPGERKPFPFHFAVRVSRADSQFTWSYTCR